MAAVDAPITGVPERRRENVVEHTLPSAEKPSRSCGSATDSL